MRPRVGQGHPGLGFHLQVPVVLGSRALLLRLTAGIWLALSGSPGNPGCPRGDG